MARSTTPPGQLGEEARHGLADNVAGAENAVGITPEMRSGKPKDGLDQGPDRHESGAFGPANYALPKRPKASRPFIRMDR
jgi:hypothetical protein